MSAGIEIAKPFISATREVLAMMAGIDAKPQTPYVKKGVLAEGDITAVVGITGTYTGTISISFPKQCAIAVVRGMLGDDIEDILQDSRDAVGEVCNMISGQARAGLAGMNIVLQGSTPSVIVGSKHSVSHAAGVPVVAIPFATANGSFTLEFCLS
ncbi:MAG: chemotaxis protein CheX [Desulfovibrionaceae bacterium]|nr:chemotaxis protein CheX [Desulfovibrionaceae bacterium]